MKNRVPERAAALRSSRRGGSSSASADAPARSMCALCRHRGVPWNGPAAGGCVAGWEDGAGGADVIATGRFVVYSGEFGVATGSWVRWPRLRSLGGVFGLKLGRLRQKSFPKLGGLDSSARAMQALL